MLGAHGNTPFHDDPAVLSWVTLVAALGPVGAASFAGYYVVRTVRRRHRD